MIVGASWLSSHHNYSVLNNSRCSRILERQPSDCAYSSGFEAPSPSRWRSQLLQWLVQVRVGLILHYMVWMLMNVGPSGLAILKNFREEGFTVTVFEKRDSVGGVWSYSDDEKTTSTLPCE